MSLFISKSETEVVTVNAGAAEIIFSLLARLADPNKNFFKQFEEGWNLGIELSFGANMESYCKSPENIEELMELLAKARSVIDEWPDPIPPEYVNKYTAGFFTAESVGPASKSSLEGNFKLIENLFKRESS